MLAAMLRGALLAPVLLAVLAFPFAYPMVVGGVLLAIVAGLVGIVVIGSRFSEPARLPVSAFPIMPAASRAKGSRPGGDATIMSTAMPVRATAHENLASVNPWRHAFATWRYRSAPKRN